MSSEQSRASQYTVLAHDTEHEIEIRRSRFMCVLRRVDTEDAAREVIAEMRSQHRLARHHCSAFLLGPDRGVQRSNDDGEPSGTAGTPMLDALALRQFGDGRADLSDVVAVVVRWFGGVLLGAGGLVRAYSDSVSSTLDRAVFMIRRRLRIYSIEASHADAGRIENELRAAGYTMLPTEYGAQVTLSIAVRDDPEQLRALTDRVAALTFGASELVPVGVEWVDEPN